MNFLYYIAARLGDGFKTGLSRDQLSQLARDRVLSSGSLSNMVQRQNSFDALMSLGFQSLQSIDKLANLIHQSGGGGGGGNAIGSNGGGGGAASSALSGTFPESGLKNANFDFSSVASRQNIASAMAAAQSSNDLRRFAAAAATSHSRMENFLHNLSHGSNLSNSANHNGGSSSSGGSGILRGGESFVNLQAQLEMNLNGGSTNTLAAAAAAAAAGNASMASLLGSAGGISSNSIHGGNNGLSSTIGFGSQSNPLSGSSVADLANLLRHDSHTGLSALRMKDGMPQRNSSVDDFLSLMAAGDIPHQDASLLNVPLMQQQRQNQSSQELAAHQLAQQLLQVGNSGSMSNAALANLLASRSMGSIGSLVQQQQQQQLNQFTLSGSKRSLHDIGVVNDDPSNRKRFS
jgi:hypothetical protein